MHIFGDPSRIPIIIVERAVNSPLRSTSGNSFFSSLDQKYKENPFSLARFNSTDLLSGASRKQNSHVLKIVVFVHGFQACDILFVDFYAFLFFPFFLRFSLKVLIGFEVLFLCRKLLLLIT